MPKNHTHLVEQSHGSLANEQVGRCPTHGVWALVGHACTLCQLERSLHPSNYGRRDA